MPRPLVRVVRADLDLDLDIVCKHLAGRIRNEALWDWKLTGSESLSVKPGQTLCKGQAGSDSFEVTREQEMIGTSSGGGGQ